MARLDTPRWCRGDHATTAIAALLGTHIVCEIRYIVEVVRPGPSYIPKLNITCIFDIEVVSHSVRKMRIARFGVHEPLLMAKITFFPVLLAIFIRPNTVSASRNFTTVINVDLYGYFVLARTGGRT